MRYVSLLIELWRLWGFLHLEQRAHPFGLTPRMDQVCLRHVQQKFKGGDPMSSELSLILSDVGCRSEVRGNS